MKKILLSLVLMQVVAGAQPAIYKLADLQRRISDPDTTYVVNFWATWCKPCIKELPAFDSLHTKYLKTPVKVLLVTLDFTEQLHTRVIPFLVQKKVKAECVLLDESNGNDFINAVNDQWSGAIPATLIKRDTSRTFREGSLHLGDLERLLEVVGGK